MRTKRNKNWKKKLYFWIKTIDFGWILNSLDFRSIYYLEGFLLSSDGPVFWLFWVLCWRSATPNYCYHWYNWQHPLHSCFFMPCQKNEYISQSDGLFGILWYNLSGIIDVHFRCSSSLAIHSNNICIYSLHYIASTNCSYRNQWLV